MPWRFERGRLRMLLALALTLGPTCALAYLGYRDLTRRERDLGVTYAATATVLRDRLITETALLRSALPRQLPSSVDTTRLEAIQSWLTTAAADNPWATGLHLAFGDTIIVTPHLSYGWPGGGPDDGAVAAALGVAEEAEFKRQDLPAALAAYRSAAAAARTEPIALIGQARIARTLFKLQRYDDGIAQYRALLHRGRDYKTPQGLPYVALALEETVDGLELLGRTTERNGSAAELLEFVADHPWDVADGYGYHLKRTLELSSDFSTDLVARARERLGDVAALEKIAQASSAATADNAAAQPEVRYVVRLDYVQARILPKVEASSGLSENLRAEIIAADDLATPALAISEAIAPLSNARVKLVDSAGRTLQQISLHERWMYGGLLGLVVVVLIAGVAVTTRAWERETELSKLRTDFVANVSHELKTPLALIRMFGETLESGIVVDPAKQREFYGVIRRESERLTHLINNVLDTARIEAGTRPFTLQTGDIVAAVRDAVDAYSALFARLGFEVTVTAPDAPVVVQFDRDAVAQTLVNLFQNAIRYSDHTRRVDVTVTERQREAVVSVKDQGIGIPAGELTRIFDKFYRSRITGNNSASGSGLGLSIVKDVMQAHGGRVDVRSVVGQGSEFVLVFPIAEGIA